MSRSRHEIDPVRLKALVTEGKSRTQIASLLGCSPSTISKRCVELAIRTTASDTWQRRRERREQLEAAQEAPIFNGMPGGFPGVPWADWCDLVFSARGEAAARRAAMQRGEATADQGRASRAVGGTAA